MKTNFTVIDGSLGEGGGQILRSSLALSLITGKAICINNIRANRKKPGLMRQHLTAVRAAATISRAEVTGDEVSSPELTLIPGKVVGGGYVFQIGTAGSTTLVFQTILFPLLFADEPSVVEIHGGTHNSMAPTFDFIERVYLPMLKKMGADVTVVLEQAGFYPVGQGRLRIQINPLKSLNSIDMLERGGLVSRKAVAGLCHLEDSIGKRELQVLAKNLDLSIEEMETRYYNDAVGSGNVLSFITEYENMTELFAGFGERGVSAESVAKKVAKQAIRFEKSLAPVGDYLADQLLLPMALSGGGSFRAIALTEHFKTNKTIIETFLDVTIQTTRKERLSWLVEIK